MPWDRVSRRRAELPPDWPAIRQAVLNRDGHQCQIRGPRCTGTANEVDHLDRDDHRPERCRAACQPCHSQRTAAQGHQAMRTARAAAQHPHERHPGLV